MAATLSMILEIITPEGIVLAKSVDSVTFPTAEGTLTVLPGHEQWRLVAIGRAHEIAGIARGQNRQRMIGIGEINETARGRSGDDAVVMDARFGQHAIDDIGCAGRGKWPDIEDAAQEWKVAEGVFELQGVHAAPRPLRRVRA